MLFTRSTLCLLVCWASLFTVGGGRFAAAEEWKAGVARAVITPKVAMWMAGYGGRTAPAAGTFHDLWIRVLAVEAADGRRGVILSSDTLGISQPIYEAVVAQLKQRQQLDRSQIMLHASHTHCGPVLKQALYDIYPLDDAQIQLIEDYSQGLIVTIVETVEAAIKDLQPSKLSYGIGHCDFAVNRRTNREPDVPMLRAENRLMGPVDHTVPVLAVHGQDGALRAVVFGYACHNTTLGFQQWCGDYAGFAQYDLEARHPGVTALFTLGCGADQNPLPRRTVELAQEYGKRLADAVDAILDGERSTVAPKLATAVEMIDLKYDSLPSLERLRTMAAGSGYLARWAGRNLKLAESDAELPKSCPYPVQVWRMGTDLLWITLGGEVVVDYSLRFKGEYGWDTWVSGYVNDVMAYIPSERVLLEGGYEGQSSMYVYGHPAERWAKGIEPQIAATVQRLVKQVTPAP